MGLIFNISYNGFCFFWQSQLNFYTFQDLLQFFLFKFTKKIFKLISSSRIDKNVHSIFFNFCIYNKNLFKIQKRFVYYINKNFLKILLINWVKKIDKNFHPRYSAFNRIYCYIIYLNNFFYSLFYLDYISIKKNIKNINFYYIIFFLKFLLGVNNFYYFTSSSLLNSLYVRIIYEINIIKKKKFFYFIFIGNSFLYNMIRNIFSNIFLNFYYKIIFVIDFFYLKEKKNYRSFIPQGLYLIGINYPISFNL